MRNLDEINAAAKSTRFMFTISLIIPMFMGWSAWALSLGAAPTRPLHDNYFALSGLMIIALAILALPVPYLFRWNWETKYFGASFLSLATASIGAIYPLLCIAWFSTLPLIARLLIVSVEIAAITKWCSRFAAIYKKIYADKQLFRAIYEEEPHAVYFTQQGDKKIVEQVFKFNPVPQSKYFLLFLLAGLVLVPFASPLSSAIGIPFIHVFLAITSIPLTLMFLGMGTKMWLVCYFYPNKIQNETNKPVYIDMSSKPRMSYNSALRGVRPSH